MKVHNILLLLLVLLFPFMVNAQTCDNGNVKIKAISLKEKTENVEELERAIFDNKKFPKIRETFLIFFIN